MVSVFNVVHEPYVDPVFSITQRFRDCTAPSKVNLGVGVYRDMEGKPSVLNVVKKVERELANDISQTKDYLMIEGLDSFVKGGLRLAFGEDYDKIESQNIDGVQSISGTGAYRLAVEFLFRYQNVTTFYIPDPTWPLHRTIPHVVGVKDVRTYPYCKDKPEICYEDTISVLKVAQPRSGVVFQVCGNNPTGLDFSHEQWEEIAQIIKDQKLIPILDLAYLGFVSGSIETDSYPVRLLAKQNIEMFVCVSFAKNMGLYNERVGILGWSAATKDASIGIKDRTRYIIRNTYSNPPAHGAKVAAKILNCPTLMEEWCKELKTMAGRIITMRESLLEMLKNNNFPRDWSFVTRQRGLFSFTDLSKNEIKNLEEKFHIFMLQNGRINISALHNGNIQYVVNALCQVVTSGEK